MMPELKNYRHELFARAFISNYGNRTLAAKEAGYSPRTADKQGSRLYANAEVRARIEELSKPLDEATKKRMEDSKAAIYARAWELAASNNPKAAAAAVQALRLIVDMQLLGPDAIKLQQLQDKNDMERERLQLQREAIKAGADAKNVSISIDTALADALQTSTQQKKP